MLVSVIVPTFNPTTQLKTTLDSVYAQTYKQLELIIVDDGSTIPTDWIKQSYPKAKFISQQNAGVSVARNRGVLESAGSIIAFLDHDDVWLPTKIEKQVELLEKHAAAFCVTHLRIFRRDEELSDLMPEARVEELAIRDFRIQDGTTSPLHASARFFAGNFFVPSTVIYRRNILAETGLLDPNLPFTGDFDVLIRSGALHRFVEIHEPLVMYRVHETNFSKQYRVCQREIAELRRRYRALANSSCDKPLRNSINSIFKVNRIVYSAHAYDQCRTALKSRNYLLFARHFVAAARFHPLFVLRNLLAWSSKKIDQTNSILRARELKSSKD